MCLAQLDVPMYFTPLWVNLKTNATCRCLKLLLHNGKVRMTFLGQTLISSGSISLGLTNCLTHKPTHKYIYIYNTNQLVCIYVYIYSLRFCVKPNYILYMDT